MNVILDVGIDINIKEIGGYQSATIHTPTEVENIPILRTLLERGVNPDVQDKYKMTAVQLEA
ncbi:MAG: hypothetical protein LBU76_05545 [Azoarcus sp.]|nr:hypothetical protein [Azoarcus sp.]